MESNEVKKGISEKDKAKRNARLLKLFHMAGYDARLIGKIDNPSVIINDSYVVSCYVHNFFVNFTTKPWQGEKYYTYRLSDVISMTPDFLQDIMSSIEHRALYKVELVTENSTPVYLAGFNFKNRELGEGKYPVFSYSNPLVFFEREKAEELVSSYSDYCLRVHEGMVSTTPRNSY